MSPEVKALLTAGHQLAALVEDAIQECDGTEPGSPCPGCPKCEPAHHDALVAWMAAVVGVRKASPEHWRAHCASLVAAMRLWGAESGEGIPDEGPVAQAFDAARRALNAAGS